MPTTSGSKEAHSAGAKQQASNAASASKKMTPLAKSTKQSASNQNNYTASATRANPNRSKSSVPGGGSGSAGATGSSVIKKGGLAFQTRGTVSNQQQRSSSTMAVRETTSGSRRL